MSATGVSFWPAANGNSAPSVVFAVEATTGFCVTSEDLTLIARQSFAFVCLFSLVAWHRARLTQLTAVPKVVLVIGRDLLPEGVNTGVLTLAK